LELQLLPFAVVAQLSPAHPASGSIFWQIVFVSFAIVLVLFEVVRGWRQGGMRQFARVGALIAAYMAAFFGGKFIVPLAKPFFKLPDIAISTLGGAALALLIYLVITGLGRILFKRTGQQESAIVRFLYGVTGAALGLVVGAFFVWIMVVGVRAIGTVADARVQSQPDSALSGQPQTLRAVDVRRRLLGESHEEAPTLLTSLARLKNSLELGTLGEAVKSADIIPPQAYETLGKAGQLLSDPDAAERFLRFPGAHELSEHPRILALRDDRQIVELIEEGRFIELLQNQHIIDALNDPDLVEQFKKFDLQRALDYATKK
jgi:hypothetical protein